YAYVLYKNGKLSEADETLQAALQQFQSEGTAPPFEVYEHLGMIKEALGDSIQAIDAYSQALEIGGDGLSESVRQRLKTAVERLQ
ncbi:tetratricopeptide repeat protein, partial [bacterium]|nr:tetratricopeptide repeat protein [bacterium]